LKETTLLAAVGELADMTIAGARMWTERRARINHDWLKNRYLQALGMWMNMLDGQVEDRVFERRFIEGILPEWVQRRAELEQLLEDYPSALSPAQLLAGPEALPISNPPDWLGAALHALWLRRERIPERVAEVRTLVHQTDDAYARASQLLQGHVSAQALGQVPGAPEAFAELRARCEAVGRALSALRGSPSVT
jgi:hypothetical protein